MELLLQAPPTTGSWMSQLHLQGLMAVVLYSVLGLLLFVGGFMAVDRCTPGNLWKEILEQKNMAVAVLMGAFAIALSIIISAAIQG
jgi:putative membrane protein